MANNLLSRIAAMELKTKKEKSYLYVVVCKGGEPTPDEEAEKVQAEITHERVMLITFHKSNEVNHCNT